METASGQVSDVQGSIAVVEVSAPVACRRCAAGKGCGAGLLAGNDQTSSLKLRVPHGMTLRAGDRVSLAIAPRQLLKAAWLAYGLPLIGMVLSVGIAALIGANDELTAVAFALAGIAAGVVAGRRALGDDTVCHEFRPVIEGVGDER